ncbi:hypothetical protein PIB30_063951, partial [Stylosanthes scabra]|nr:hypothetical protein [Stylosanthes scabra]
MDHHELPLGSCSARNAKPFTYVSATLLADESLEDANVAGLLFSGVEEVDSLLPAEETPVQRAPPTVADHDMPPTLPRTEIAVGGGGVGKIQ